MSVIGSAEGEIDDQSGAGSVAFALTFEHSSCRVQGEQGTEFTITGSPDMSFDFSMTTDGAEEQSFSGGIQGAVEWATADKDGVCSVAYEFSGATSATGFAFGNSGTVCGVRVEQNVTVSG